MAHVNVKSAVECSSLAQYTNVHNQIWF